MYQLESEMPTVCYFDHLTSGLVSTKMLNNFVFSSKNRLTLCVHIFYSFTIYYKDALTWILFWQTQQADTLTTITVKH